MPASSAFFKTFEIISYMFSLAVLSSAPRNDNISRIFI